MKNMQQLKRPQKPIPLPTNHKKITDHQHLSNLTTQIFCSFLSKYDAPFSLRDEQIDKLIAISYKLACRIDKTTQD